MAQQQSGKNAKKVISDEVNRQRQEIEEQTASSIIPSDELTDNMLCSIVDKCRTCTFKELQMMPECQPTGFRLIKRCVERETTSKKVVEDQYLNEACHIFNGALTDFESDPKNLIGNFAEPNTQPASMLMFMMFMSVFAFAFLYMLNKRKTRILGEIYSKISIVDR